MDSKAAVRGVNVGRKLKSKLFETPLGRPPLPSPPLCQPLPIPLFCPPMPISVLSRNFISRTSPFVVVLVVVVSCIVVVVSF